MAVGMVVPWDGSVAVSMAAMKELELVACTTQNSRKKGTERVIGK